MKQADYTRMAEKCARDADRMPPGPERDELLKKAKLFESYGWRTGFRRPACSLQNKISSGVGMLSKRWRSLRHEVRNDAYQAPRK